LQSLKDSLVETVASLAGDIVLLLDRAGIIREVAGATASAGGMTAHVGQPWTETVTADSRPKVKDMLAGRLSERWRQVNQLTDDGEIPVRFLTIPFGEDGGMLAIGRDERASAALQQRLLQVQQSLERDYLALRQAESRYRLVFDMTAEPLLVVEAATRRIREINPAARVLLSVPDNMTGQALATHVSPGDRERLIAYLGAASTGSDVKPLEIELSSGKAVLSARPFRQGGVAYMLIRLDTGRAATGKGHDLSDVLEKMPDAFVLTDAKLRIATANAAFVELVQASSAEQLHGRALSEFLGRPGIDLDLIVAQLNEHGAARNVATILRGMDSGREEIEVSAVYAPEAGGHYGFSLRVVARRLRDLPPVSHDMPRTVEQLTELVGRMPLKDIVRESTDLIERQCIEAALSFTSNNRASAAEILGLSRQSLYSKLHRHGLVSSDSPDE
jgi:transcriptional regulator PpsR